MRAANEADSFRPHRFPVAEDAGASHVIHALMATTHFIAPPPALVAMPLHRRSPAASALTRI